MRVGLLIYGDLDTVSGGYLYDRKLVEYLRSQGDEVEIISLPWRNYARHLGDNIFGGLRRRLLALDVDVLVQDELNHPSLFRVNRQIKDKVGYKLVSIVHHLRGQESHPLWQKKLYRRVEQKYLETVDAFVFVSETTRADVIELVGEPASYVVVNPAGDRLGIVVSPEEIEKRARQIGPLELVFLGNVTERKGLDTVLKAMVQIPQDSCRLQVVGGLDVEVDYTAMILRMVEDEGLGGQVVFHGPLDDGPLIEVLSDSHVMVVPSWYEGFGIVYLEGMAMGLPAIAGSRGAAGEIITHGLDGYLVEPGNAEESAGYLAELNDNRGKLARMGTAARQRFDRQPGWEATTRRLREFLLAQC